MTLRPKNADFLPYWRRRLSVPLRSNAVEVCWRLKRLGRTFFWHNCEGETKTQTFTSSFLVFFLSSRTGTFEFNSKAFRSRSPSAVAQLSPGDFGWGTVV